MKQFKRKIAPVALAAVLVANMGGTAVAAPIDIPAEEECRIVFSVEDRTGGVFTDDITVTLLSLDGSLGYTYTVSSADYLFGQAVRDDIQQGEYNIALNYDCSDEFAVENADGTEITSLVADGDECVLNWAVVYVGGGEEEPSESTADEFVADSGNAEADAVWNSFLAAVAPIETDGRYAAILKTTQNTAAFDAQYYAKATGGAEEEYLNMSAFEQFLWYATYVEPVNAITSGEYDYNCSSVENWIAHAVSISCNLLKTFGNEEMLEAYKTLMEWDYHYFLENGAVYNFMTGKSSSEEHSVVDVAGPEDTDGEQTDKELVEIPDVQEDDVADGERVEIADVDESEEGIWGETAELIKENAVSILLLLVLTGALGGVVISRKRKMMNED